MKKFLAILLAAAMILATLAGCQSTPAETTTAAADTEKAETEKKDDADTTAAETSKDAETSEKGSEEESTEGAAWTGEVEKVVMTWIHGGNDNAYLDQVQSTLNDYLRDKIGVEIEFRQVSVFDAPSQYTMWIGGGEEVDLMGIAYAGLGIFIQMNMLEPLDDYLASAPHIQAMQEEGYPLYDTDPTEGIHGINVVSQYFGRGGAFQIYTDVLEATGLSFKDGDIVTMDDVDEIARKVKELNPNAYVGVYGSTPRSDYTFMNDPLGGTVSSGVILGLDSTEVVDYFETDEYKKYLEVLRGWYNDGLVLKDAATTDAAQTGVQMLNDADNCPMMWNEGDPGLTNNYESNGRDISNLFLKEIYYPAINSAATCYWTVPVTAKHPEAAMRLLDMMYSDPFVFNTMVYGVEGVNYEFANEEKTSVNSLPDGSYWALGIYGNQELMWSMGEPNEEVNEKLAAWNETALKNKTAGFGFCYDPSNMTNQITALDAVLSEYRAALETGSADLETVYPEFIQKLKANGIDDVIADKQAQFDAWLAQQK